MKKVFVIYIKIPEESYTDRLKYLIPKESIFRYNSGFYSGLYAWSTDKSLVKDFMETRGDDKYVIHKYELSKEDFKEFKFKYSHFKLAKYRYYFNIDMNDDESSDVTSTKFEYIESTDNISENMNAYGLRVNPDGDYLIFKDKYVKLLDIIGYTTRFDLISTVTIRQDFANYQNSFNLTPFGNKNIVDVDGVYDQLAALVFLFKYPLYGQCKDYEYVS